MLDRIMTWLPPQWRDAAQLVAAPIAWIPRLHDTMLGFFLESPSTTVAVLKCVFLLFPAVLALAAIWCTHLSLYTLPFRAQRRAFLSTLLVAWWDAARMIWLYWVGTVRAALVLGGWALALVHLVVKLVLEAVRQVALMPFSVGGRLASSYFQPGVPWVAFVILVVWCLIEATVFTYTLLPTVNGVLRGLAGVEEVSRLAAPITWFLLLMLVMGSFACIHAFIEVLRTRQMKFIVQMVLVKALVMVFEVVFLYRPFVEAVAPWLGAGDAFQPRVAVTVALAAAGWLAVRGMTWFLFARYGTPPLLAFISRQPLMDHAAREVGSRPAERGWWRPTLDDFRRDVDWLHDKGDRLLEHLALPALHVLAGALNFAMVLLTSRPLFSLPFRGLRDAMETHDVLARLDLQPTKSTGS